jgi:hypothetical protein
MFFRKRLGLAALVALLSACNQDAPPEASGAATTPGADEPTLSPARAQPPIDTVRSFLRWYQRELPALDRLLAATVRKQGRGDTAHYQVDTLRAVEYLAYLRQSGRFSRQFLLDQRQQFRRRDAEFRRTKQAYGPPVGFEFGWLLYTPRPAEVVAAALQSRQWTAHPSGAPGTTVRVELPSSGRLDVELVLEDDTARIESVMPNGIEVALPE